MSKRIGRRNVVAALAAGAAVVAFDPVNRTWITAARATTSGIHIPNLDGELVVDAASRAEAADDYGHIIHRTPVAVLRPGSVRDIVTLVRFANQHGIVIAMRGQGHSMYGQAQAGGGVVIDSRTLNAIDIGTDRAIVGAGVRWIDLLQASLAHGLTPPILTDLIDLSIGGTLSVGGIGGHTHRVGLQIDNVIELEVVTGEGHLRTCSQAHHADLFESVLGGLGQFAIIVKATIPLAPAKTHARVFKLFYSDLGTYLSDQRKASADERFDYLEGEILPAQTGGGWMFMLEAAAYYTPPESPDSAALLAGLSPNGGVTIEEQSYFDWQNRLAPLIEALKQSGLWLFPHPLVDLFLPDSQVERFVASALAQLDPADTANSPMLFYPFKRSKLKRPFLEVPNEETLFLFDILRTVPPDPAAVRATLDVNRALFEQARNLGGKRYAISAVEFSQQDWREHFGRDFFLFALRKAQFDPKKVLAPGQGIFAPAP